MTTPIVGEEQAALEAEHIAWVQGWAGRIGEWTIRAAAMRQEREQLEKALTDESARIIMQLVRLGIPLSLAEQRVEQLLERAFTPAAV